MQGVTHLRLDPETENAMSSMGQWCYLNKYRLGNIFCDSHRHWLVGNEDVNSKSEQKSHGTGVLLRDDGFGYQAPPRGCGVTTLKRTLCSDSLRDPSRGLAVQAPDTWTNGSGSSYTGLWEHRGILSSIHGYFLTVYIYIQHKSFKTFFKNYQNK